MKNKNKKKRRKILLAILMIGFTGVILTTSTYAWFTANKTVTVSQIDVNVAAANGLQVSVDGVNWKTVISNGDITGASATYGAAVNQLPSTTNSMVPVSTGGDVDAATGFLKMYKGAIESNTQGNYILTAAQSTETNGTAGDFIAFDLFFQVNDTTAIYLTSNSNVQALNTSKGIENAARVAFVPQGNAANGTATATIQALKAATNAGWKLWEPNDDVHTAAAVANANSNYGITTTTAGAAPLAYIGVKAPIATTDNILLNSTSTTYFTAMTPDIQTPASGIPTTAYASLLSLQPGITKIRVYMWVEGQDVDCENNASGGSLSYNLQFSSLTSA